MNSAPILDLQFIDWISLFLNYLLLSMLSVGGVITTAPEMHRYLVEQQHWLIDTQFNTSIAIAQAAPGPNVLFVALLGWNVGMNAGGLPTAVFGMLLTMSGILLPSTTLAYLTTRWGLRNKDLPAVRAFKQGMGPIVIALLIATGWILASANNNPATDWPLWLLTAATVLMVSLGRLHLLFLLAVGALLGAYGLV